MRVGFLMCRQPDAAPLIMREVASQLTDWGGDVVVLDLEPDVTDLAQVRVDCDLYALKSVTEASLGLAGVLESLGATVLNTYRVTRTIEDKPLAVRLLRSAGVPVPDTYLAWRPIRSLRCCRQGRWWSSRTTARVARGYAWCGTPTSSPTPGPASGRCSRSATSTGRDATASSTALAVRCSE